MSQPDNEAVAVPDLYVVIVKQTFCIGDGFAIVPANHSCLRVAQKSAR
jgi:hypothetical protein